VVSIELYKSAIEEGKTKVRECESHQEKVSSLNSKVKQLEWQLKGWQTRSDKDNSSTSILSSSKRVVTSKKASKEESNENKAPLKVTSKKASKEESNENKAPLKVTSKKASKEESNENKAPHKPPKIERRNVAFTCVAPLADKIEGRKRITMVRAAGGRKGLQEKLNQVRSPRAERTPLHARNV
jgi:hypothetical protein